MVIYLAARLDICQCRKKERERPIGYYFPNDKATIQSFLSVISEPIVGFVKLESKVQENWWPLTETSDANVRFFGL